MLLSGRIIFYKKSLVSQVAESQAFSFSGECSNVWGPKINVRLKKCGKIQVQNLRTLRPRIFQLQNARPFGWPAENGRPPKFQTERIQPAWILLDRSVWQVWWKGIHQWELQGWSLCGFKFLVALIPWNESRFDWLCQIQDRNCQTKYAKCQFQMLIPLSPPSNVLKEQQQQQQQRIDPRYPNPLHNSQVFR